MGRATKFLAAAIAAVAFSGVLAAGASAGQPDKLGTSTFAFNDFIADCGTFQVWDDAVLSVRGIDRYDKDGDIVQTVLHYWGVDRLYSPETGKSFSGTFASGATLDWVKGIPWTEYQAVQATHGITFRITVPGAGVVFLDVGTIEFELLAFPDMLFQAGPHQFLEGDVAGLCAAMA